MVSHGYDFEGKTVTQKVHLNLNRNYWTPIGTEEHPFRGNFSGGGYSISGMRFEEGVGGYVGLFGYVSGGSVADVLLAGSAIAGGQYAGSIAGGVSDAQIADCYVESSVKLSRTTATGHVAGLLSKGAKVLGCASNAKAANGADRFGIVGSKDETSVVWHSLYADAERFIVGTQPAFRVVNKIEDATINYGVPTSSYSVSNIVAYENGMSYAGSYLAVEGETMTFSVEGHTITMYSRVMVGGVSLTASDGWYSFQMQARDVNITQEEIMLEWQSGTTVCRLDAGTFTVASPQPSPVGEGEKPLPNTLLKEREKVNS